MNAAFILGSETSLSISGDDMCKVSVISSLPTHWGYVLFRLGTQRDKTGLLGFWQSKFKTSFLSYRDYQKSWNVTDSKSRYDTFQWAKNKGADPTVRMQMLHFP